MEDPVTDPQTALDTAFEGYPLTRTEYITAMVHFYRGERSRADAWRNRLDPTTNWAVVTTAGMLSFTFGDPYHSHVPLLLANVLVVVFLCFEARRFRYFDVWRPPAGSTFVAEDLDEPKFKITFLQAVALRLRCNYIWIFSVILVAWLTKITAQPTAASSLGEMLDRMAVGVVPGGVILLAVTAFFATAVWLAVWAGGQKGGTDEVHGLEKEIAHWKT